MTTTAKYVLLLPIDDQFELYEDRPKQESIKGGGVGEYTLCRADGQVLKEFVVTRNRNANLTITGQTPSTLNGLSTLNLERLVKYYERIVKIWPEQNRSVRQVQSELSRRAKLMASVEAEAERRAKMLV